MTARVLFDSNIVIDHLHKRAPFFAEADALVLANEQRRITAFIAAFTIPTLFYLSQREYERALPPKHAIAEAFNDVRACLEAFKVCNINYATLQEALRMGGEDYEDNLQVACAKAYHLDAIITRDKKFQPAGIELLTPSDLLKRLARTRKRR